MAAAPTVEVESPLGGLIDVSAFSLAQLRSDEGDALDEAIRRVTQVAEDEAAESVCAFNSAI